MTSAVYTAEEVAQLLQLPKARVYELIRRRMLPAVRFGKQVRIPRKQLDAWLAGDAPLEA